MLVDVAAAADVREGQPLVVIAGNREVALTRWREKLYAVRNICPHQSQSFKCALVRDSLSSSMPGEVVAEPDRPILACPWHGWQFDLATGGCVTDPTYRVRSYTVRVHEGRVLLDLGAASRDRTPEDSTPT
jgi:nitrite reductase/ring-hydroxylating ferredoxin subunit